MGSDCAHHSDFQLPHQGVAGILAAVGQPSAGHPPRHAQAEDLVSDGPRPRGPAGGGGERVRCQRQALLSLACRLSHFTLELAAQVSQL